MAEAERRAGGIAWPDVLADLTLAKAHLARWRGEPDRARRLLEATDPELTVSTRASVMDLYGYLAEDLEEARACRRTALDAAVESAYPPLIAGALVGIADLALRRGRHEQAAWLLAASEGVRGTQDHSRPDASRIATAARDRLGEAAFAEAAGEGRRRDWRELAELALAP
jgi:hypothetical protein